MHGTGFAFFDDASLVQLLCHPPVDASLVVAKDTAVDPLMFAFPFREQDGLLCGYCPGENTTAATNSSSVHSIPVATHVGHLAGICRRCSDANYTRTTPGAGRGKPVRVLASFETGEHMPFTAGKWTLEENTKGPSGKHTGTSARLKDAYIDAHDSTGLATDWTGYDILKADVFTYGNDAQTFYVEIRDKYSTGYWSRVNWYTSTAPGWSTVAVPLQIFVGEKTVTKERRRLYLASITRLVYSVSGCAACEILLDNVRLETVLPYMHVFPELIRIDMGSAASPIQKGFVGLTAADYYRARVGYGVTPGSVITRTEDRRHPTNFLRDWVGFKSGGIVVDLPPGEYTVALFLEDAGYWEYFPSWRERTVRAEGRAVVAQTQTYADFVARYFNHQDTEDLPGQDTFARYVVPRYTPLSFTINVTDGQLNVDLESSYTYACALQGIVIFPSTLQVHGEAFLGELFARQKDEFDYEYVQAVFAPTGSAVCNASATVLPPPTTGPAPSGDVPPPFSLFHRHPETHVRTFDGPVIHKS